MSAFSFTRNPGKFSIENKTLMQKPPSIPPPSSLLQLPAGEVHNITTDINAEQQTLSASFPEAALIPGETAETFEALVNTLRAEFHRKMPWNIPTSIPWPSPAGASFATGT